VDTEVALLNQKIDLLTEQLAAQRQQIDRLEANTHSTSDICQKMDAILDQLEAQRQRSLALEELKNDLIPIGNQMVKLTIDELAEIGSDFQLEDLLFLGDNIVLILNTIKSMTQPEIMNFVHNTLLVAEKEVEKPVDISYSGLIRQMRDPSVRRGLALTMRVLQVVGTQPEGNGNGTKNN
jgi:uncharacterized protein YjgD (DUF1641 family)